MKSFCVSKKDMNSFWHLFVFLLEQNTYNDKLLAENALLILVKVCILRGKSCSYQKHRWMI